MKRLRIAIVTFVLGVSTMGLGAAVAFPSLPAFAEDSNSKAAACDGLTQIDNTQDCNNKGSGVSDIISTAVEILSYIAGVAAVIMVVVSGFRYITSGGDSNRVSGAKNTLVYALIGIAVAALAQVLVHFVLSASAGEPAKKKKAFLPRPHASVAVIVKPSSNQV